MKSNVVGPVLLGGGLLLVALSIFWPTAGVSSGGWTEEKAARKTELIRYHHGGAANFFPGEQEKATEELEKLNAELQAAQDQPASTAAMLRWSGVALAGLGLVVFLIQREN